MTVFRLIPVLVLTGASLVASPVSAGARGGGGQGASIDASAGDCVTRRVTGPGGAYRWERVECDSDRGWSDHDQWGYGHAPLAVETRGDRYGGGYARSDREDRGEDRYGPAPTAYAPDYVAAGRDRVGYLIWPGKRP